MILAVDKVFKQLKWKNPLPKCVGDLIQYIYKDQSNYRSN